MKKKKASDFPKGEIVIYKAKDGIVKLEVELQEENIWLDAHQIAMLFGVNRPAIVKHINNIYKTEELVEKVTCSILEQVAADGKMRKMNLYNLDMIISVGYRVNSQRATQFRIWATRILKNHLLKGFTLNEQRLKGYHQAKLGELESALRLLKRAIDSKKLLKGEAEGLLKVITDYTNSWILLQKYDEGRLVIRKNILKIGRELEYDNAKDSIAKLKNSLIKKKSATDIFGQERGHGLEAIFGNLKQSFGGKKLYPTLEEQAAHLLYFVIKDHPFVDGNKRIASFLFVNFLAENNQLLRKNGERKINDNALVALALLVAQSHPKEKESMVALVTNLLF
ncbi:MAG: virulence protein RhuM/Fic/DOC family protein [Candidatus Moranbacteria bacterium]|nr:virulence protein RhuM/Fic/DOC family protein [Candidatus Moranbacteria bacterium]